MESLAEPLMRHRNRCTDGPTGVYVSAVYESSAAQRAGLAAGDVIVGFNGQEITTMEELQEALEACNPGDEVTIDVRVPGEDYSYSEQRTLKTLLGDQLPRSATAFHSSDRAGCKTAILQKIAIK